MTSTGSATEYPLGRHYPTTRPATRLDTSKLGALEQRVEHGRDFGSAHPLTISEVLAGAVAILAEQPHLLRKSEDQ